MGFLDVSNIIFNPIILLNIFLWVLGYYWYQKTGKIKFLFLVFYVCFANEFLYYLTGYDLYYPPYRTELHYSGSSFGMLQTKERKETNPNLTEGYFKDKQCVDWKESEQNRFEEFIRILNIEPGESVLDAGCGFGGLVMYLRSKGINAEGITITKTQYKSNTKEHGPYFHYGDYSDFHPQFVGKFDHIIVPGSLEHPFGGNPMFMSTYKNKYEKMADMFTMFKKYFKPDSMKKNILTTTLHINLKYKDTLESFVIERAYGGAYPSLDKYSVADSFKKAGYNVTKNDDYSWHYYQASFCDLTHFGNPTDIGLPLSIAATPLYPHVWYIYWYWNKGYWMWQWSGKNHERRSTKVCYPDKGCDLEFIEDPTERPVTLYYTVAKLD